MQLDAHSIEILEDKRLHKDIASVCYRAATLCNSGIGFKLTYGFRSVAEQMAIWLSCHNLDGSLNGNAWKTDKNGYAKGIKAPNGAVGTGLSRHNTGHAVDIAAIVNGKITWDTKYYPLVADYFFEAAASIKVPIVWGGSYHDNKDYAHFELNKRFYP